jgi:PAS domain S-box-containing protein
MSDGLPDPPPPLFKTVFDNAPTPVFMKDRAGEYFYVNATYEQVSGSRREKILGRTDFDIYRLDVATECRQKDIEAMERRAPVQSDEPIAKDRGHPDFTVVKFPIIGENDDALGVCGISVRIADSLGDEARTDERNRLAAELHDDALQVMATVALRLETLVRKAAGPDQETLDDLREMVSAALQRLRTLTSDMQVVATTELDLRASIEELLEALEREHSISFSLEDHLDHVPHPLLVRGLDHIAREALINVTKHAQATHIDVSITELNGGVQMAIVDDGVGFEERGVRSAEHMGLSSMRSRAHALGGELQIHTGSGAGTRLEVRIPDPSK